MKTMTCPCGAPITIGDAYKVPVTGPYTIKRPCPRCPRINEVVLRVSVDVQRADWHVTDCHCGNPLYLRHDYSGEGNGLRSTPDDHKNRTVTQYCRSCKCRFRFVIRFKKKEGGTTRHVTTYLRPSEPCHKKEATT